MIQKLASYVKLLLIVLPIFGNGALGEIAYNLLRERDRDLRFSAGLYHVPLKSYKQSPRAHRFQKWVIVVYS